ncbi:MAG: calcium-translocating P-type ATPase, PMCA-type [Proteiniphilum sp.]|jgi:Ca2+-transporting ATPase|nr:calcium-translocating P-type ATPase, PMCA-type [Proteiniphilum sp.]MDD2938164.1 calcium-translocating P-type ATPase, PMCA-type [Proteiniphilum sp.]MDD3075550.1 calcium-translocating P-type ATPase, PMCA-type [Proteiniphilum sp.]MDD3956599.1 calcium-translocating P-type ATPase, PMCA-type [Proteiniphilum sp.]MDD4452676.1 calcium-translocating P-type ATPase, PMCA-type [Proteiniphilum sp.]
MSKQQPDRHYSQTIEAVLQQFQTDSHSGLSIEAAAERLAEHGPNRLESRKQKSALTIFFEQFKSSMVLILLVAAIISAVIGVMEDEGLVETFVILAILVVNAIIGTVQELKAQSSLEALNKMSAPHSKVLRGGQVEEVVSTDLVPGDIVVLDTGDIIPADLRLIETANLKIQESALTGESVPVEKNEEQLADKEIPLGDRHNMAFSTSIVTYGRGRGVVIATGMGTEVGKIAHMLQNTEATETPMGKRLEQLGRLLGYLALAICALIFLVGLLYGNEWLEMLMMAVSLAVAAIPEGLQIVSTIVLAIGVQRLVKQNAIVRTLPSVETLGSTTVICSDKTGTLTQNRMTVVEGWSGGNPIDFRNAPPAEELDSDENMLLQTAVLCTDAHLKMRPDGHHETAGDPTETAIVDVALGLKKNKLVLDQQFPRVGEVPFDSGRKRMATINKMGEGDFRIHVKGGLDEVLAVTSHILIHGNIRPITDEDRETIRKENHRMAQLALRVLAVAYRNIDVIPAEVTDATIEKELVFIGLLGMIDPARPEVMEAVKKCRTAGIRPVMITGDHKVTAVAIASEIGIYREKDKAVTGTDLEAITQDNLERSVKDYSVYARVAPEHKVRIVQAWQLHGDIVAMTGDGVNDAPALKQADIGVSMGIVGTEVAKDASDVVLTDDNFATIVRAVEEGRRIYDNILKAIQFLLSSNVGEVLLIFIAFLWNLGNPLSPILILWINLVTDSLPALALSMDPAEKDIMTRKPRDPQKGIFSKGMIWRIFYQGSTIGLISLAAYLIGRNDGIRTGLEHPEMLGQTMAFAVLGLSQLLHVRNLHSNKLSSFRINILANKSLLGAIFLSILLLLLVLIVPGVMQIFGLVEMDSMHWLYVIALSFIPIVVVELMKLFRINHSKDEY